MSNPEGVRRKCYSKVRLLSWVIAIDKYGFVGCQTANCKFMAFNYDDMQEHYSNCLEPIDESKLKMCPICKLGSTKDHLLNNHMIRYHPVVAANNSMEDYLLMPNKHKRLTKITKDGWILMLEQKGYIKCLTEYCNFLTDSVEEMETHYGHCYEWYKVNKSCYSCIHCEGKTATIEKMTQHIAECHPPGTTADTPVNNIPLKLINRWKESVNNSENIFCNTFGCKFVTDSVEDLKRHYRFCRMPQKHLFATCSVCSNWCLPYKLADHLKKHADLNQCKSDYTIVPDPLDPVPLDDTFEKRITSNESPLLPVKTIENPKFATNGKVLRQYPPRTRKALLKNKNMKIEENDARASSEKNLDSSPKCPNDGKTSRSSTSPEPIRCMTRKRKSLVNQENENHVEKPKKVKKIEKSVLDKLGTKIMEETAISFDELVPIEITVDNVQWTVDVPPMDIAQKVVERERLSLKKMIESSLEEAERIFYWTNNGRKTNKADSSPSESSNMLKNKILELKMANQSRRVPTHPQSISVINLNDPSNISAILKKYAPVPQNEEDKIFNNLVNDVETALDEEDEYDIPFLMYGEEDF